MQKNKTDNKLITVTFFNKFQRFSSSVIIFIVAVILLIIGVFAIKTTVFFNTVINFASEECVFKDDNILINLVFCIITLILMYFIIKYILPKISSTILCILMIIFSLLLGFWWINYIELKPNADQSMVVYCAESLLDDNLTTILEPGEYLNRNPHQLGCIAYIMTVFTLFGTRNPLVLQNLNVIYFTISAILLYFITKKIFKEDLVHKICLIFISIFSIYWTFFSTHIYGNIPGLMFALLAILFTLNYLENCKIYNIIIIGISITIAYLLKSNYQILLCAILIILGLHTIKMKKVKSIISAVGIIIFMFSFKSLIYSYFENSTGYSLDTGVDMTAYVYMGIAEPATLSPGWYTGDVEEIYKQANFDKETSKTIAQELLTDRISFLLSDLNYTYNYFKTKLQTTWLNPTFQVFWCSTPSILLDVDPEYNNRIAGEKLLISILTGTAYKFEERFLDIYQIITFLSASIGIFLSYKEGSLQKSLLPIIFLGGFIFHIIWETKSIYVIQYFYLMIPFASFGLYKFRNLLDKLLNKYIFCKEKVSDKDFDSGKILEFKRK